MRHEECGESKLGLSRFVIVMKIRVIIIAIVRIIAVVRIVNPEAAPGLKQGYRVGSRGGTREPWGTLGKPREYKGIMGYLPPLDHPAP